MEGVPALVFLDESVLVRLGTGLSAKYETWDDVLDSGFSYKAEWLEDV